MLTSVDSPQRIRFGVFEVDRRAHELRRQGTRIHLQEQPYQVLLLLLDRAGEVITRDEFRAKLWPSSVFVDFDHGLNNAIGRLREALGDSAAAPHFIETLPKRGYRFIYPIAASDEPAVTPPAPALPEENAGSADASAPAPARTRGIHRSRPLRLLAIGLSAVIIGALAAVWQSNSNVGAPGGSTALPAAPSIAVMPFESLSSDPENEVFADGLSEELASRLAGIDGLEVASQTSAFSFKGRREPVSVIARALNVNHLLEGSVRSSGTNVRVTAQLIDAVSGYHRWSETYERELTDIFRIQEEISLAVAEELQVTLLAADARRLRKQPTHDPEAYRLYLVARGQIAWVFGAPDWAIVKASLEAAIARDPEFAAAHAFLAHYYFNLDSADEDGVRLGRAAAERAVALDEELSEAFGARANFEYLRYREQGDFDAYVRGRADYRRALELDPSNAQAAFHYARATFWTEPDLALDLFERTLKLDPVRFSADGMAALLLSRQGRHDEARQRIRALYDGNPGRRFHTAINLAALEYYQGHLDDAVIFLRESMPQGHGDPLQLWALEMSLGDRTAAIEALALLRQPGTDEALADAARLCMDGRFDAAFGSLERHRTAYPASRVLDVPAARLALIVNEPAAAAGILELRLPDLVTGDEPVDARNVLAALDLAAAWSRSGARQPADELLDRIAAFLDSREAPHWPMYIFLRARTHAIAGESEQALKALDRAYAAGFRTTWAVDVFLTPFLYIDPLRVDPAFDADPGFAQWLARIDADNSHRLARLRSRDAQTAQVLSSGDAAPP